MTLTELLKGVTVSKIFQMAYGHSIISEEVNISTVQYDSRKVSQNDMFVAIKGVSTDGHNFITAAISNGAKVVVVDNDSSLPDYYYLHAGVVKVVVPDSRIALAQIAENFFDHPSAKLIMVGVTGTNGKTTTTHLVKSVFESTDKIAGLIGTIEYKLGQQILPATHTTPESLELSQLFAQMVKAHCSAAIMEVSSHALHQHRASSVKFDVAIFTNLTQDHLDYHRSMEEYYKAKAILFENLPTTSWAVINSDDEWGRKIPSLTRAHILTYGVNANADVQARNIALSMTGIVCDIMHHGEKTAINSALIGRFNVSNILAAFSAGIALGIPKNKVQTAINNLHSVRGRFEQIASPRGWTVVIDYAHSPDALEKALQTIHDVFGSEKTGNVITVFGCGGNRDRSKRPAMAQIATTLSNVTILTSDNPRHEDPESIIDEAMMGAVPGTVVYRQVDRKKAIIQALDTAAKGDVVLIAGKGHEEYQLIGDRKLPFSDRAIVEEYLQRHP
jgi:UDP-N-acetylmuramoyl-L-alanyl-D-glutamate--2,6-diaminopimelate ligase